MSDNLQKYFKDLEFVSKIKCEKTKKALMKYLAKDPKVFLALREIALNIIKGNIEIDKRTKRKLSKDKEIIYKICNNSRLSAKERRDIVVQSGGWILAAIEAFRAIIDLLG